MDRSAGSRRDSSGDRAIFSLCHAQKRLAVAKKLIPLAIFVALLLVLNLISNSRGLAAKDERVFTSKTLDAASRKSGAQNTKRGTDREILSFENPASDVGAKDESGARNADGGAELGADTGDLKSHPRANERAVADSKDEADVHRRHSADYEASNSQNPAVNSKNQPSDEPCISRECVSAHIRRTGSLPQNLSRKSRPASLVGRAAICGDMRAARASAATASAISSADCLIKRDGFGASAISSIAAARAVRSG